MPALVLLLVKGRHGPILIMRRLLPGRGRDSVLCSMARPLAKRRLVLMGRGTLGVLFVGVVLALRLVVWWSVLGRSWWWSRRLLLKCLVTPACLLSSLTTSRPERQRRPKSIFLWLRIGLILVVLHTPSCSVVLRWKRWGWGIGLWTRRRAVSVRWSSE